MKEGRLLGLGLNLKKKWAMITIGDVDKLHAGSKVST
jgi:hypothetical protein